MAEESGQERTEEATPKRLQEARKKGQVPRSRELNTFASLMGSGVAMATLGPTLIDGLKNLLVQSFSFDSARAYDPYAIGIQLFDAVRHLALLLAPILLLMCVITIASPVALGGWLFTTDQLLPKFERIDPFKGLGRIFSTKGLLELAKALVKFILVATVVFFVFRLVLGDIITLSARDLTLSLGAAGGLLVKCFLGFSVALVVVVAIDVPYQLWEYKKQLMMTKQEIREEMKDTEGRPEVKQAIRARQQEIAQRRMMEKVPKADVVITNPTHYAVAIQYDRAGSGAPVVVAKGKDHIAAKIREIAGEHGVPLFAAPPLARALYGSTELDREIPENLFVAVAQVLAYIYQLRKALQDPSRTLPQVPSQIKVPEEYTRKEQA